MDYPGWELKRQRAALAALLLGGGAAEGDTGPQGPVQRSPAEDSAQAVRKTGMGQAAVWDQERVPEEGTGPRMVAHRAGGDSSHRRDTRLPPSAWEEILGAEAAAEVLERKSWGAEFPEPAGGGRDGQGAAGKFPGRGSRAPEAGRSGSGRGGGQAAGDAAAGRRAERELDDVLLARAAGEAMAGETIAGASVGGEAAFARAFHGGEAAGKNNNAAARDPLRAAQFRSSSGKAVQAPGQDGLPVFQSLELTGGTGPWSAGRYAGEAKAEDGARALSRAVQRDARRYDGGFTIY